MATALRILLSQKQRLREIQVLTLSKSFQDLDTNTLLSLKDEAKELITKVGASDDQTIFDDIESRIDRRLMAKENRKRFYIQIAFSILILTAGIFSLISQYK